MAQSNLLTRSSVTVPQPRTTRSLPRSNKGSKRKLYPSSTTPIMLSLLHPPLLRYQARCPPPPNSSTVRTLANRPSARPARSSPCLKSSRSVRVYSRCKSTAISRRRQAQWEALQVRCKPISQVYSIRSAPPTTLTRRPQWHSWRINVEKRRSSSINSRIRITRRAQTSRRWLGDQ